MGKLVQAAIAACLLLTMALGSGFVALEWAMDQPGPHTQDTVVIIEPGTGFVGILQALSAAQVIAQPALLKVWGRVHGGTRDLKAGEYVIPAQATPRTIVDLLRAGQVRPRFVTVPEGLTSQQIWSILSDADGLQGPLPTPPPQGTLLPETYRYSLGDTRAAVVDRMGAAMTQAVETLWPRRAENLPLETPEEAVILASIVEREAGITAERPTVAAVFLNRLRRGMPLQADPTVIYALTEGAGPLERALNRQDWKLDHPYNTYQNKGLPPGPICHPGRASLEAVLNPAAVDYVYFVADGTGGHVFARTLAEHNRNVARWRRIRDGE